MAEPILKPCPCCGVSRSVNFVEIQRFFTWEITLFCPHRGCDFEATGRGITRSGAERRAIRRWNRRADYEDTGLEPEEVRPVARGAWEQREVYDARGNVYELQSAFCPVCKRYHTTPYLYSFTHYDYCPNCGAKMDEIEKSIDAHAKRGRCGRADMTGGADG